MKVRGILASLAGGLGLTDKIINCRTAQAPLQTLINWKTDRDLPLYMCMVIHFNPIFVKKTLGLRVGNTDNSAIQYARQRNY